MGTCKTRFRDRDFVKGTGSDHKPFCCVMVARDSQGVAVRDSKDPTKATLEFNNAEWNAFVHSVKVGDFEVIG